MRPAELAEYEGTSGPSSPSTIRALPRVDVEGFDPDAATGVVRAVRSVMIRARWNFRVDIGVNGVTNNSIVMASIAELFPNPGEGGQITLPDIGAAHMYVRSVAPQNGLVKVNGYIDFDRELTVRVSLFIA